MLSAYKVSRPEKRRAVGRGRRTRVSRRWRFAFCLPPRRSQLHSSSSRNSMATRQLAIKTGVVNRYVLAVSGEQQLASAAAAHLGRSSSRASSHRLVKEVQSYKEEADTLKIRVDKMEAEGQDIYEVRQQVRP